VAGELTGELHGVVACTAVPSCAREQRALARAGSPNVQVSGVALPTAGGVVTKTGAPGGVVTSSYGAARSALRLPAPSTARATRT
jgi:hypothetical protein